MTDWEDSGFEYRFCPSTDRIDNTRGYELENIQCLTVIHNIIKGHNDKRKDKNSPPFDSSKYDYKRKPDPITSQSLN